MKFLGWISLAALCYAAEDVDDQDVNVLTDLNFKDFVAKNPISLIECKLLFDKVYAPWCGHCKQLKPEYAKAATELKPKLPLAKVDCTVEKKTCEQYEIQGFPTLKIFREGKASEYQGQRSAASIVETMKRQLLPAFTVLKSADKLKEFAQSEKVVIVGFFNKEASKERKVFEKVANSLRDDFVFGIAEDEESLKSETIEDGKGIVLYKKFDEKKSIFDSKEFTEESVTTFVNVKSTPIMDDIGPSNYDKYLKTGLPMAYFFYGTPEERSTLGPSFEKVAKDYQGKILFVYLDASQFGAHADNLGLKQEWPAFGIHIAAKQEKYPFDQTKKLTEDSIAGFVKTFDEGKMTPFQKSEPIPKTNDGAVKVIVGKSFEDIALDEKKDVLVEFYAPWCGHCKKLAPIWEDLGEKVKHENIVIAKMDAASNDAPSVEIQGFPTIILFKAKDNTKVTFAGDRSVSGFYDFLVENAVYGKELKPLPPMESDEENNEEHDEEL